MKTLHSYSIGRDPANDICVVDNSMMVSRFHAVLRIRKNGQYTILDQSTNGTYVNGMRITSGVEVPVSRKDTVNFAHIADMDWSIIPNHRKKVFWIVGGIMASILILAAIFLGLFFGIRALRSDQLPLPQQVPYTQADTIHKEEPDIPKTAPMKTAPPAIEKEARPSNNKANTTNDKKSTDKTTKTETAKPAENNSNNVIL